MTKYVNVVKTATSQLIEINEPGGQHGIRKIQMAVEEAAELVTELSEVLDGIRRVE